MARLVATVIAAFWVCAIALIAAQNGSPVSLQFLGFESIRIPFGILLAFCVATGMVSTALVLPLFATAGKSLRDREDFE